MITRSAPPDSDERLKLIHDYERRRRRQFAIVVAIGLALPIGLFVGFRLTVAYLLRTELRELQDVGFPTTWRELNDWYRVPAGKNAADMYLAAFGYITTPAAREVVNAEGVSESIEPWREIGKYLGDRSIELTDELRKEIDQTLEDNAEALKLLYQAAESSAAARYPVDLSLGYGMRTTDLSKGIDAAHMLSLQAIRAAERGDVPTTARAIESTLALGNSYSAEPILITQLVRVAILSMAVETLERAIRTTEFDDTTLAQLITALEQAELPGAIIRGYAGELAIGTGLYTRSTREIGGVVQMAIPLVGLYDLVGLLDLDRLVHLGYMKKQLEAASLPVEQRYAAGQQVGAELDRKEALLRLRYMPIAGMLAPHLIRAVTLDLRTIARLRGARIALAVARYRRAHGELPESLDQLAPEFIDTVPADPFTGKPMVFLKLEDGWTLYSLGEDGQDHGGARLNPEGDAYEPGSDIPFTVPW